MIEESWNLHGQNITDVAVIAYQVYGNVSSKFVETACLTENEVAGSQIMKISKSRLQWAVSSLCETTSGRIWAVRRFQTHSQIVKCGESSGVMMILHLHRC